jgi:alpha-glucoside transport system permease protein
MGELFKTLLIVVLGVGGFVLAIGALYWLASRLPEPWRERARVAVFVGPAVLLLVGGLIYPSVNTAKLSLYKGSVPDIWNGLGNYEEVFTNDDNLKVLSNNLWWAVLATTVSVVIGVTIARFADRMRGEPFAKALIFLPTAISMVGAGIIWRFVYANNPSDQYGLLNAIWVKLDPILPGAQEPQYWLQEDTLFGIKSTWIPGLNTIFMIVVVIWIQAGFATVVISAALKGVPDDLVEAAKIDGATDRQAFFRIVLPYIKTTIITVATTITIAVLKIFDIVQTMTAGLNDTNVLANDMYTKSFTQQLPGYGAALAVILFVLVIPVVIVNARNQRSIREANS